MTIAGTASNLKLNVTRACSLRIEAFCLLPTAAALGLHAVSAVPQPGPQEETSKPDCNRASQAANHRHQRKYLTGR
jgi:hypothetical protein